MCQSRFERPWHAHFENAYTDVGANRFSNAHILKGLQHIQVSLARGDDAEAGVVAVADNLIEAINARKLSCGVDLIFVEPEFLLQGFVGPAGMNAIGRELKVLRNDDFDAIGIDVGRNRRVHVFGNGF